MLQYLITPFTANDILSIIERSQRMFGTRASTRYEELIWQSIHDLCADPSRAGCTDSPYIYPGSFVYHLKHSRTQVSKSTGRVRVPCHFLVCRLGNEAVLEVLRVIHDSMSLDPSLLDQP
jgi:toxin ParE1/3/4